MRSDLARQVRNGESGFSLLEALISLAIAASFLAVALSGISFQSIQVKDRLARLIATEFAYSTLEEYRATYPMMSQRGKTGEWTWSISEKEFHPESPEVLDGLIRYIEVTVKVWREDAEQDAVSLNSLIARRS